MSRAVDWTPAALRDLKHLDRQTQEGIREAVYELAETGRGDVRKLKGVRGEWRLRVGDWRVRFSFRAKDGTIEVLRVRRRDQAY